MSRFVGALLLLVGIFVIYNPLGADQPNILWLSTEDIGPQLACYGDKTAATPRLDAFAKQSLIFDNAWSTYPVCAPARTTIITGMYAASNGAGNMRSNIHLSQGLELFPVLMRKAGYYCTNKSKTDYNHPHNKNDIWDACSGKAHWSNRPKDKPFFAVINYTGTHESKIRKRPHKAIIDPANVKLPPYWPDHPNLRQDWAQYYDNLQTMDEWFARQLEDLQQAGLADDTIVVFFGDHGSGMPRHKRFAGDSGLRVPFLIHVPEKFKDLAPKDYVAGAHTDELVGFVDLAPTVLSLAGIQPPAEMQGRAIMGKFRQPEPNYLFGFRDRMDERPDFSRSVRNKRFIYVRNFMPHLPAGQHVNYQFQTPSTKTWHRLFVLGKLNAVQSHFWRKHPPEELYDLKNDPHETINLANSTAHAETLEQFRNALQENTLKIKDLGFMPEAFIHDINSPNISLHRLARDEREYPLRFIYDIADRVGRNHDSDMNEFLLAAKSDNSVMRYWAAIGLLNCPKEARRIAIPTAMHLLSDPVDMVAVSAAEFVARYGEEHQLEPALSVLLAQANLNSSDFYTALHALNAIDRLGDTATPILGELAVLPTKDTDIKRGNDYVERMINNILNKKK